MKTLAARIEHLERAMAARLRRIALVFKFGHEARDEAERGERVLRFDFDGQGEKRAKDGKP